MRFSDLPTNPDSRMLRQFAVLWIVFFGTIGGWQIYKGNDWGTWILNVAIIGGVAGLIQPKLLKPIFVTWMILAFPIGFVVSHVVLGAVFFLVIFPLGQLMKLRGRDTLRLKRSDTDTYWQPKVQQTNMSRYTKQF